MPSARSNLDTFKTEYHPHSGRATSVETFSTFGHKEPSQLPVIDEQPWQPFACRADFEFAELAHGAALNKNQTDELLRLIWRIADGQTNFTFKSHGDVSKAWDRAAAQMTPFEKHTITVQHKREELEYNMYTRPLWDWALDLLQDPLLMPHFVWDAQRLYKHDGTRYERFVHEPWTADRWWNVQSSLPENGVPFAFILYADKTHLSSAGTVKAYPVFARCGNLPVGIRNTDGLGGGRMVGWLPIVPDDSEEDGKLTYVNLKRVVWHKSFFKLLETIIMYAQMGYAYVCYDGIMRWLYAFILLLSADYEEQCVMALIRGTNCHCPCPICLVPSDKLYDNASTYPIRSSDDAKAFVELWTRDRAAGEKALKEQGLRPVTNVFWSVPNSDPQDTISQDHLHVYHMGQWKHLFGELKRRIAALGRSAEKQMDDQFDAFPRWRNLNHFDRVTNITYSDGNKLRDISKQVLYAAQNILTHTEDEAGYVLLQCIASYLHIDMYISLEVQTESTIAAGRAEVFEFQNRLEEYIKIVKETDPDTIKNWNFPKIHSGKHIFDDIMAKGAARNFSTRPNEKQHGPIKKWYLRQTNRKNIADQILELDHRSVVSEFIRSRIEYLDEERRKALLSRDELEDTDEDDDELFEEHLHIGSPLKNHTSFAQVEEENKSSRAFHQFRKKLATFLNHFLPSHNIPLPDGTTWLKLRAHDQIHEHRYLKVHYESAADWKLATDYLRCNPSFHGKERRDYALIRTQDKDGHDKNIFVQILYMFKHTVGSNTLDLALVLPMDALIGPLARRRMDRELRLTRLRARPTSSSEFITLHSIIRGALVVPNFTNKGDYFLVDYVDTDMFLRTRHLLQ
ncbi:hypothetical protein DEU56DRAFT_872433 [Suillus clintonianus]|uniref:uncharacterized protein n=1 Tax=Suillus clintonianus TaxID=1904413 RepID=UPI001B86939F|nr:uncharacterized protein DEU56DRAFT_872433 [Suillus clintonianus]KAG2129743.1 hypothetical protein DEU56DRAFT_872433 [Suillus clintonianus]